ncbi:MAG TPA: hypothetical protein VGW33_11660 [Terriglobia bacterium]|nr:hypothetical protein [Terriglobia bacterium]
MKTSLRWTFTIAIALALAVILMRALHQVHAAPPDQDDDEEAVKTPSRVSVQNDETVVSLSPGTQHRAGIVVASLKAVTTRGQMTAPAVVLSAQEIVSLRNNYLAAQTRLEKARATAEVAQQEYRRLAALYRDNQNASRKAVQSAQGTLRLGQADVQAAQQDLSLQALAVHASWGDTVGKWVVDGPPTLDRVLNQHEFLVQVTLPAGTGFTAPPTISLEISGSIRTPARLISTFPRIDPRIQGVSFLYITANHPGFAPELSLVAHLSVGRLMRGVLVPESAIVWWQGSAWAYQQSAPGRFVPHHVPTGTPLADGLFVSSGFVPGDQIVVRGAQALLSEEFRSQIQPEH